MKNLTKKITLLGAIVLLSIFSCKKDNVKQQVEQTSIQEETVSFTSKDGGKVNLIKRNNEYILGGDVILSREQLDYLRYNDVNNKTKPQSAFLREFTKLWPNKTVYYTINNPINITAINTAINHWKTVAQINFVLRTNQPNYVTFTSGPSAGAAGDSQLGMIGGQQLIRLVDNVDAESIIHEIGHTVGMVHEQCRADRDTYINVNYGNIINTPSIRYQYDIIPNLFAGYTSLPFDYNSVMLYASYYDSVGYPGNTDPQITTKTGGYITDYRLVPPFGLSAGDIDAVKRIYYYDKLYAKLRMVPVGNVIDDPYQAHYEYTIYVDFFQDAAATIPVNLDIPIYLNVLEGHYNYYDNLGVPTFSTNPAGFPLTPGSHSYMLYSTLTYADMTYTYDGTAQSGSSMNRVNIEQGWFYKPSTVY